MGARIPAAVAIVAAFGAPVAQAQQACAKVQPARPASGIVGRVCSVLDAVNAANPEQLRELMAADFALTSVSGRYYGNSREQMISRWTAKAPPGTVAMSLLLKINRSYETPTYGFVSGVIEDRTTSKGRLSCQLHSFTDFWEFRGGRWLWVQSHESGVRHARCLPP